MIYHRKFNLAITLSQTRFIRFVVRFIIWKIQFRLGLSNIRVESYINLKRKEKTALRWDNPLSIYRPDPIKFRVIMFNKQMEELDKEREILINDLISKLGKAKRNAPRRN